MAAAGTQKLKPGTVLNAWRKTLDEAGASGTFARITSSSPATSKDRKAKADWLDEEEDQLIQEEKPRKRSRRNNGKAQNDAVTKSDGASEKEKKESNEPQFQKLNKVLKNRADPEAVRQAKGRAQEGKASLAIRNWLFPPKKPKATGLAHFSFERFSNLKPPVVLDPSTIDKAVAQLSKDPRLGSLIARVGANALIQDCGQPKPPTQARLFDTCVRAITFTMISVDAGNAFMRRLAIKIGVCIEQMEPKKRSRILSTIVMELKESKERQYADLTAQSLMDRLLGADNKIGFTYTMLHELVGTCLVLGGKQSGYPHLCGITHPCGKHDDPGMFLAKARAHVNYDGDAVRDEMTVSAGFSKSKADFLIALVDDFASGKISGEKIAKASDREAAKMLRDLKGLGDWSAGQVLMNFLKRADIMLYGDLTVRNFLNDLYDINHNEESATQVESVADFPDSRENRNLIDAIGKQNGWEPYRSVVSLLMYHLQEENLVLL